MEVLLRSVLLTLCVLMQMSCCSAFIVNGNAKLMAVKSPRAIKTGPQIHAQVAADGRGNSGLPPRLWWKRNHAGGWSEGRHSGNDRGSKDLMRLGLIAKGVDSYVIARARRPRRLVTNFFLITNLCIFVLQWITKDAILEAGAKVNYMITTHGQYYRFVTPMFLHVGLLHILVNSMSLNAVGPQVEAFFGPERTAITYVLAGIAGNVMSFMLSPNAKSVGASGAIFGLVGALGVFLSRHEELLGNAGRAGLNGILQTCVLNLMIGLIPGSQIDNWGHIGGALGGAAVALMIGPNIKVKTSLLGNRLVDEPIIPLPFTRRAGG